MTREYKRESCPFIASDLKSMIQHNFTHEHMFECKICSSKYKSNAH